LTVIKHFDILKKSEVDNDMTIGAKLKQLRENNNMTRKDAAEKLRELGIDISDKTLYGYESGRNSANADMFLALCRIYRCNNIMETFSEAVDDVLFTNEEWKHIEKYRDLDDHGKEMVDFTLNKEHERSIAMKNVEIIPLHLQANAAHKRTDIEVTEEMIQHDNDIMDGDDF
jgi:transcriptional regulator with XRE-family HTH domain